MKTKWLLILLLIGLTTTLHAQIESPVHWAYGKKKIGIDTYEIHLRATVDGGWHIYSQQQPDNAVAQPTSFKFNTTNQIILVGKTKELGKLEHFEDPTSGIGASQYSGSVDFVQVIRIKDPAVSIITGTLTYQTCNDHMCLQPEDVKFSVPIK